MGNKDQLTLGSLFDGVGGFPLAGLLSDIKPIWSSEIDPFPIRVTTKRLPDVIPLGDVSALNGAEILPVDIITFGSPCQDMSIAGKRAGLDGARSGLFHEAIRIIKEMREKTNGEKPRWIVWENVPGCYSSNHGEDFRQVLEEIIQIKDSGISVPLPPDGRWSYAGYIVGDHFSVAWRTLDAQYFRTAQRRRRCYLVADFGSEGAGFVQFESEGLYWNLKESGLPWERAATHAEDGTSAAGGSEGRRNSGGRSDAKGWSDSEGRSVSEEEHRERELSENEYAAKGSAERIVLCDQGGERMDVRYDKTSTLRAEAHHPPIVLDDAGDFQSERMDAEKMPDASISVTKNIFASESQSASESMPAPESRSAGFCTEHSSKSRSIGYQEECSPTLRAGVVPGVVAGVVMDTESTPESMAVSGLEAEVVSLENHPSDGRIKVIEDGKTQTLAARMGTGGNSQPLAMVSIDAEHSVSGGGEPVETVSETLQPQTLKIRSGKDGGGKGPLVQDNISATLATNNDQVLFVQNWDGGQIAPTLTANNANGSQRMPDKDHFNCVVQAYGVCSKSSHAMESDNPHSGFYEADTARTLDRGGGNPGCNQGGIAVVSLQGSMIGRSDQNGPQGDGVNEDVSFTLNTIDRHAVAYGLDRVSFNQGKNASYNPSYCVTTGSFTRVGEEISPTLLSRDYKDPPVIGKTETPRYIVRRLTPWECARLQGFPDDWCDDLGTQNPTDEEVAFWMQVFEIWRMATDAKKKPKTEKRVRRWLEDPYSDSAAYKAWGNGIALPCAASVLSGIAYLYEHEEELKEQDRI